VNGVIRREPGTTLKEKIDRPLLRKMRRKNRRKSLEERKLLRSMRTGRGGKTLALGQRESDGDGKREFWMKQERGMNCN